MGIIVVRVDTNPAQGLNAAIAEILEGERAIAKISHVTLSGLTGLSKSTLIRYLNKERDIPVAAVEVIAIALNVDISELIHDARTRLARGNVIAFPQTVPTEEEAVELGAVAKDQVEEVDPFPEG
jgi:transcriptional regulator with XRE-family HTH domain